DHIETFIAISDVLVNMSINTPALLSIVSNKNALYFDETGNRYHPFSKILHDKVIFSEKDKLIEKINRILYKGERVCDDVPEDLLIRMDAYRDNKAIDRMRQYLVKLSTEKEC
ncbi:hypothetical protein KAR91_67795, partial [Candidatus Pacearchaeota archaeon]|nr:hypothetical protein [Candidatus Pacearchaeota archaeon]